MGITSDTATRNNRRTGKISLDHRRRSASTTSNPALDDRTDGLSPEGWVECEEWHFPWAVISARKPLAEG